MATSLDSFKSRRTLTVGSASYDYYSLPDAEKNGLAGISRLPFSLKILLENLLRHEDGRTVTADDIRAMAAWLAARKSDREIAFRPARVLMQDFTGVPAVVDLAAMRDAMVALGGDPARINPLVPVDLVIDHSVMVDASGNGMAFAHNVEREYERNGERYQFLRWGQSAFENFRVVPPGTGICHQVNLEYLAQTVWTGKDDGRAVAYPDTLVGTDSHTTMVNGLAVLGWGVGGIEAEAAMLGQPISMLIPEVVGFRMSGRLPEGITATDLVLTVTQMLRKKGVVGKFVEFFGPGLSHLSLEDQATIANMAPEYGATCGFFPVDKDTLAYLKATGREAERIALVEAYSQAQGMYREDGTPDPMFTDTLSLDLATVVPSMAGPKRPQDRIALAHADTAFEAALADFRDVNKGDAASDMDEEGGGSVPELYRSAKVEGRNYKLTDGDVVIAAITSCTNTSNPNVLIAAGLVAKNAHEKGLTAKPWVKTSLAPGSQVVTEYLAKAGLQEHLDALGFNLVGYGCTTCIGNSGPLPEEISEAIGSHELVVASVLSGNRNFEGRVNPDTRANYLASPPLVVTYALTGSMRVNVTTDPIGTGKDGAPVYLKDIWPTSKEVAEIVRTIDQRGDVPHPLRRRLQGRRRVAQDFGHRRPDLHLAGRLDLCAEPALFRRHHHDARAGRGHRRCAHPRPLPRFHHHRPHLARRLDQARRPRRRVSHLASGAAGGVQLLRLAPRQPSGDDARHLRQHPHQEPDGAGRRRRRHHPLSLRRWACHLRRRHALRRREGAAGHLRRQGIRHRLVARLGGQGHAAPRRARASSPRASSASTAPTWSAWAFCRSPSPMAPPGSRST